MGVSVLGEQGDPAARIFTQEQINKILEIVHKNMAPDDRPPSKVCHDKYGGDWQKYCHAMIAWHNIDLSQL